MKVFFQIIIPAEGAVPGAVIAVQTFGDFPGFNPHCRVLCTGGFYEKGLYAYIARASMFRVAPRFEKKALEKVFRYRVLNLWPW
ncbi:MAG: hypothetical protein JW836_07975 [Deltaproteobacteria bacterium]|nr:hypothetical protein [Deltaproteobacteria bacterium]